MGKKEKLKDKFILSLYFLLGLFFIIYSVANFFAYLRGNIHPILNSVILLEMLIFTLGVIFLRMGILGGVEKRIIDFFIGLFLVVFGLFPILINLGLLNFLPMKLEMEVSVLLLNLVLFFSSVYFVVDMYFGKHGKEYSKV